MSPLRGGYTITLTSIQPLRSSHPRRQDLEGFFLEIRLKLKETYHHPKDLRFRMCGIKGLTHPTFEVFPSATTGPRRFKQNNPILPKLCKSTSCQKKQWKKILRLMLTRISVNLFLFLHMFFQLLEHLQILLSHMFPIIFFRQSLSCSFPQLV